MALKTVYVLIIFFSLFSCKEQTKNNNYDIIKLKPTNNPKNYYLWGVTRFSDLKLREELSDTSPVLKYMNQGALIEIVKKSEKAVLFDGKKDYWYLVKTDGLTGWIFGAYIEIYNNLYDAEKRCEEILFNAYEKPAP